MVEQALDGAGQLALAVFEGRRWKQEYAGRPPLLPAVCIGQIVQHEKLPDGRFNILVQGVCRATIARELPPRDGVLYREAMLQPLGLDHAEDSLETYEGEQPAPPGTPLEDARAKLSELLATEPLSRLTAAAPILEYLHNDDLPTLAVLEVISFTIVTDHALRYRLLAEPAASTRADMIIRELSSLSRMIARAIQQHPESWPKGCSWN